MKGEEEIIEVDSDKGSQHSVQEVVTGTNATDPITSSIPQFEVEMHQSYVSGLYMHIPMDLGKCYLPSISTDITVGNMQRKEMDGAFQCRSPAELFQWWVESFCTG
ncbi:hypothetical protein AQUCO_00100016v1 [Aquilegia coerulea]|uniref:Uncharacterized protein n=1 Tax=Aquilegia coerulea TaxID=218851 RepID=A0A2G5F8C1_AQUCA|nr:hypothetical protein AQUCO_00100016v1 [Aquilegia coerulea]PIA64236.1 hypothetical protein AQUCO_00100016v1 [Aquilegia coerulea]